MLRAHLPLSAALLLVFALLSGSPPAATADEFTLGGVSFTADALDFGEVPVGERLVLDVRMSNDAEEGRKVRVGIRGATPFELRSRRKHDLFTRNVGATVFVAFEPQVAGEFQASLDVSVLDRRGEVIGSRVISLEGVGTGGALSLDPLGLDYGDVLLGSKPVRKVTLTNVSATSLTVSGVGVGARPFRLRQVVDEGLAGVELPHILGVGESIDVLVRFKPREEGSFSSTLRIRSDGFPSGRLRIPLRGNGVSELGLSHPRKLRFGKVAANVFHQRTLVMKNNGDRMLTGRVVTKKLDDEFFSVTGAGDFVLMPGETRSVVFEFGATGRCKHKSKVKIVSDGLRRGKAKLKITVKAVRD